MPTGHRLDAVEPALHAAQRRIGIIPDDARDIRIVHLLREIAVARFPHT